MHLDDTIFECELEYTQCFSESFENQNIVRFRDPQLMDMRYHNLTYLKKSVDKTNINQVIKDEIALRLNEGSDYCNILINRVIDRAMLSIPEYKLEISRTGFYWFDPAQFSQLQAVANCTVKKVDNQEMVDTLLSNDLQHDEDALGRDFCTRRCYRRGQVYVTDKGVNSYICYHNDVVVGNCDLFIHKGVAKIEDFSVLPEYQRQGYGTTILKSLTGIARQENCHTIYLVTDEEDTAKEMYLKNGFRKVGDRTALLFKL